MKKNLLLIICLITACRVCAQDSLFDQSMKKDFAAQVKSLEEFQNRFNGSEIKPGINNGDSSRRDNILSLFDFSISHDGANKQVFQQRLLNFTSSIIENNIKFDMYSQNLYSECKCLFKYQGKDKHITLILQRELNSKGLYRWAIVSAKGLFKEQIVDSERLYTISPVENEVNFMGLQSYLNENPTQAFGYRSKNTTLNELSIFLTLVSCGKLKFEYVEEQTVHYLNIPGYIITIKDKIGKGTNTGWLINHFEKSDDIQKSDYLLKLL